MQSVIIESASEESDTVPVKKKTSTVKPKSIQKFVAVSLEAKPDLISMSKPRSANLKVPKPKVERASPAASGPAENPDVNTLPEFA